MPVVATWMDLEIIILSAVSQTKTNYHDISYMRNLKKKREKQMNIFTKQKQTQKTNLGLPKGKGKG